MSILSWLFPKKKRVKPVPAPESSGLARMEPTRPVGRRSQGHDGAVPVVNNAQPANRKSERMARRELLYGVVRQAMTRAGVLSSWYKFKVLSLDGRGRQFLIMVDLAREYGTETGRLAEIEAMVAQAAKSRYDIVVTAVYWRMNEHVAVGVPGAQPHAQPPHSQPMPLVSQPAALEPVPAMAAVPARAGGRFEPIQDDEVAAFKRALAAGVAASAAVAVAEGSFAVATPDGVAPAAGTNNHATQNYMLLTGFEDTELPEGGRRAPDLSGTQYGDLT